VYVRSFMGAPGKFQISNNGGWQPRWRGDGRELYYLAPEGKMMAATVKSTAGGFERETPKPLFETHRLASSFLSTTGIGYTYDVTHDGQRFLGVVLAEGNNTQPLTLVTNWPAGLKK
jgi:hypothetical protein